LNTILSEPIEQPLFEATAPRRFTVSRDGYAAMSDQYPASHPSYDGRWLKVLERGLKHRIFCLIARSPAGETLGILPLAFLSSPLFGRFLVSLSYVNSAGIRTDDPSVARRLIDEAVKLCEELDCRYLELRQESPVEHPALTGMRTDKCLMRMPLPASVEELWDGLKSKVRSQVRKGQRPKFDVQWGSLDQLSGFYSVFSRNMRDLGTPVFGRSLFREILNEFGNDAEMCVIRDHGKPIAAALLTHGRDITEVPSASSLSSYRSSNVNMLMYWHLLARSVERGSRIFDFGRSTREGATFQFKKQWGAEPHQSTWQYHVRRGSMDAMRPDQAGNRRLIEIWKRLPVWITRLAGPSIVRGIP
jgi:FemAB-related protein (PEP-CTERM system-associated)